MRRNVTGAAVQAQLCPALEVTHVCNERTCPLDAQMSQWEEWSECSQACNGGTQMRARRVIQPAENGGRRAGETVDVQPCNTLACDQDCVLLDWSAWSSCSKVCATGHRARTREVLRQAKGSGSCPKEESHERRQAVKCNAHRCPSSPLPRCASVLDIVLVLDTSGSMGAEGFKDAKNFAQALVARIEFGDADVSGTQGLARVGALSFASTASVQQVLTVDSNELSSSLESIVWQKSSTNTGEAVAAAAEMLDRYKRSQAQSVILVITDGMPVSSYVLSTEAARLRQLGVRLSFAVVSAGLPLGAFTGWAAWPKEENVLAVSSFTDLKKPEMVTEVLAALCPVLS